MISADPDDPDGLSRRDRPDFAERSRRTQQHVLDAAVEVLIEHGYAGASTLRIQERAGVSRGRLLHQYPQRDALLVAAVQHLVQARLAAQRERTDWPTDPGERIDAAIGELWQGYQQGFFWAATELWLAARHHRALADALRPLEHALGQDIRRSTDAMFGPDLAAHPHYPAVRELVTTSMRGVALTYSFAPRDPHTDPQLAAWRQVARRELLG